MRKKTLINLENSTVLVVEKAVAPKMFGHPRRVVGVVFLGLGSILICMRHSVFKRFGSSPNLV